MKRVTKLALMLVSVSALAAPAYAADNNAGVEIGKLTCQVDGETKFIVGSNATLDCTFEAVGGKTSHYTGKVSDYGLDIGTAGKGTLVWGVLAPSTDVGMGALEGEYGGVTAGASIGAGLKANALVGGLDKSIALNPLSIESQTGTNLTLGVTRLSLKSTS